MYSSVIILFTLYLLQTSSVPLSQESRLATKDMELKNYKNAPDYHPSFGHLAKKVYGEPDKNVGKRVKQWNAQKSNVNPEELGTYAAGDILIPKNSIANRNGLVATTSRWSRGVIPYLIDSSFNQEEVNKIYHAMSIYHDLTCIKFVPYTGFEQDYIHIDDTATGCWAAVGRIGGKQIVNLQRDGCLTKIGTILHELMHAIGFLHEQNRFERDNHVDILWSNIAQGKEENFKKAPKSMAMSEVNYDYYSVMHYTKFAFSSNGKATLNPKLNGVEVGQREGLSRRDVQKIRLMYKCEGAVSHV